MIPTIQLSSAENQNQLIQTSTLEKAVKQFRVSGYVMLKNVFATDFINTLHASYIQRYQHYFKQTEFKDGLIVGDKRYKISVALEHPFDNPLLYANPLVLPIIKLLLEDTMILTSFASVVALSGAPQQEAHRDHPWLFGNVVDRLIPSYAIKLIIPLVNLDKAFGTIRVWPGSHIEFDQHVLKKDFSEPLPVLGDCLLMDYRVLHQGSANCSEQVRPVLFVDYSRPWFRDSENFKKQKRLTISKQTWQSIAPHHRHLFDWIKWENEEDETLRSG